MAGSTNLGILRWGTNAERLAATNVPGGTIWVETDTSLIYTRSPNGSGVLAWFLTGFTGSIGSVGAVTAYLGGATVQRRATATNLTCDTAGIADYIVGVTSTAAPRTITLPAATNGRVIVVKDESEGAATNNITVVGAGGSLIDGAANFVINTNGGSKGFYSDGTNWFGT